MTVQKKKLIEVALPLPEINDASAYDKMPGIGPHPKGIHHWWARLPLPAARAVLFASLVDDPSSRTDLFPTEKAQDVERERLFDVLRGLLAKKLHEQPSAYAKARDEIRRHYTGRLPTVVDPFAGGGSIPLEANRLGLDTEARDLNPVAVLLNKCNLELAPRWLGQPPVNRKDRAKIAGGDSWRGTDGIAADVRHYGERVRERALERLGGAYPRARLPRELGGGEATVLGWFWARTVASPDPSMHGTHVPLVSTYWLCSKKGSEAWLEAVVDRATGSYHFAVHTGSPKDREVVAAGTRHGKGGFRCLVTGTPIPFAYIRSEGEAGRLGAVLTAVVVEVPRGRAYLPASREHEDAAKVLRPEGYPETDLPGEALGFRVQNYGFRQHWQMFTARQLTALVTLSDFVKALTAEVQADAAIRGLSKADATEYARTIKTFLALALDRCVDFNNSFCRWKASGQQSMNLFGRSAIPMVWDYFEPNIMGVKAVCWHTAVQLCADAIGTIAPNASPKAVALQSDAAGGVGDLRDVLVSTDPPYYDNIGYAALSDFFYVWLRRTIGDEYPDLFATVLVPKVPELTAAPERFDGDKRMAKEHFEGGFRETFRRLRDSMSADVPLTVYYAFKQADEEAGDEEKGPEGAGIDLTTGWETLLEALVSSGFQVSATWPVRASQAWRMRAMGSNALASYIVLACRIRSADAPSVDRRSLLAELRRELPAAIKHLQQGNVAPVDLAQAAIGPGMATYTRYSKVLDARGERVAVREALGLINQVLDEVLAEQEGDFDGDSRWALAWFEQSGFAEGEFGVAEVLATAKVTSVKGLVDAGILKSAKGKVRLLKPEELPADWDPVTDTRLTAWEMVHHLVRSLNSGGELAAAAIAAKLGAKAETARELAYRLYSLCERKKRAQEALTYNALVQSWPEITRLAREGAKNKPAAQGGLFDRDGE